MVNNEKVKVHDERIGFKKNTKRWQPTEMDLELN
jgi:hypothetical protein